jgi:hypothetical protein
MLSISLVIDSNHSKQPLSTLLLVTMTTNPSHILIARNSRGHQPSASLSSPTETHAAASGIFRSSGSPPWLLEECAADDISSSELSTDEEEEAIHLEETFTRTCKFPGTVKIIVGHTNFWLVNDMLALSMH